MTTGDHRGQLAMAVIEAAIAAMVILAVLGAFVGVPVVEPATETGLDATASTLITALDEQPHRGAVDALCDADDAQARSQVAAALTAMLRPGLRSRAQIGEVQIGPPVPVGPRGHDVLLLPG
ncbi:UNVERIFIED_CONTAM: hypothetical protein BEN50_16810 [Euhalothece sp. KZN 001]